MPVSRGAILMTTKYPNVTGAAHGSPESKLQLKIFGSDEAWAIFSGMLRIDYLKAWNDPDSVDPIEKEAAMSLLSHLDGLPLGIKQTTALIRKKKYLPVAGFLDLYKKERGNFKNLPGKGLNFDPDYPHGVESVWNMSFAQLKEKQDNGESQAFSLLAVLCILSPDVIPIDLFMKECPSASYCGDGFYP
jgi:hypothetical protein